MVLRDRRATWAVSSAIVVSVTGEFWEAVTSMRACLALLTSLAEKEVASAEKDSGIVTTTE